MARSKALKGRPLPAGFGRKAFRAGAAALPVTVAGAAVGSAAPEETRAGSLGWALRRKLYVRVGGCVVECLASVTLTVIGSKGLPGGS